MALSDQFDMDGASIIAFLIGLVIVFDPARTVAQFSAQLQSSLILLESVRSIFDIEAEQLNLGLSYDENSKPIAVRLENVNFNYTSGSETLKNITMDFAWNKKCNCRKHWFRQNNYSKPYRKTLRINSGTINFNGHDIGKLSISSVRDQITIVSQDIVIFDQSLEDNIRYANRLATKEMIVEAARKAKIDKLLIERKESPVGPNGSNYQEDKNSALPWLGLF